MNNNNSTNKGKKRNTFNYDIVLIKNGIKNVSSFISLKTPGLFSF